MQQYMLQIIEHLETRGYKRLNPDSSNVYGRASDGTVYVVVVGSSHNLDADNLKKFNRKIYFDLSQNTGMRVEILNILLTPDGIFDSKIEQIVASMDNVWLFSCDFGRLYVYENQPQDFDGLHEVMDRRIDFRSDRTNIQRRKIFGIVTPFLVLLNIIIFIISSVIQKKTGRVINYNLALNLEDVLFRYEYYRLITAMFVHFGFLHLVSNMMVLLVAGARIENQIGKVKFLIAYFVTGIFASVISLCSCYFGDVYDYAGGASGAIFGLLGVLIVITLSKTHTSGVSLWNLGILIVLTIINGCVSEEIDNAAHLGGLFAGIIIGVVLILCKQKVVKEPPM